MEIRHVSELVRVSHLTAVVGQKVRPLGSKPMSKTVQTVQTECSDYGYKKALDSQIDCRCSRTFDAKEDYH